MSEIRICLFNPINIPSFPPLNLTYLSSYLKQFGKYRYEVKLVDVCWSKDPIGEILAFNPDIVGFTSLSSQVVALYDLARELRSRAGRDLVMVCGGAHAAVQWEQLLKNSCFDVVVTGEGEATFKELVDGFIENGRQLNTKYLSSIEGLAFKDQDKVIQTQPRKLISDLDTIPHPDRALLNYDFYNKRYFVIRGMNSYGVTTIAGSRGCPYTCIFCCVNFSTDGRMRFHSPQYIVDEMEEAVEKYNARWFFFTDDIFFVKKSHTEELSEEILRRGLQKKVKWDVQIRSNLVRESDRPLLKLMKQAGCCEIDYGFESANQRMLTLIKGKGITAEDHQRAIDLTCEAGIHVLGTFIIGTPSETYEEMLETRAFIVKNIKKLYRFQVSCMIPYPGTPLYELCVEKGLVDPDYYKELKKEIAEGVEHGQKVYSDLVAPEKVLALRDELDLLSLQKVTTVEKVKWLAYNSFYKPGAAFNGVKWFLSRMARKGLQYFPQTG